MLIFSNISHRQIFDILAGLLLISKWKKKYGVTDHLKQISVDEITWGKILKIAFILQQ